MVPTGCRHAPCNPAVQSCRTPIVDATADLIAMLRRELDIKNQQITEHSNLLSKQMGLIDSLTERIREGNVLIGSLQQRLALTDGRQAAAPTEVAAKPTRSASI